MLTHYLRDFIKFKIFNNVDFVDNRTEILSVRLFPHLSLSQIFDCIYVLKHIGIRTSQGLTVVGRKLAP